MTYNCFASGKVPLLVSHLTGNLAASHGMLVVAMPAATLTAIAMVVGEVVAKLHTPNMPHIPPTTTITNLISFTRLNTLFAVVIILRVLTELIFLKTRSKLGEGNIVMESAVVVGLLAINKKALQHLVTRVRMWMLTETAGTVDLPMAVVGQQPGGEDTAGESRARRLAWPPGERRA